MFNKKFEERLKEIERAVGINKSIVTVEDYYDSATNKNNIDKIRSNIDYLEERVNFLLKQYYELLEFLEIEKHKPDCTPYLRKKPEDTKHSEEI